MYDKGHIIVKREIKNWGWYSNSKVFTVFVHLLIEANWKEGYWEGNTIKRGELVTSLGEIATLCGLSIQEVRTCMKILGGAGEVLSRRVGKRSILTICNYDDYQDDQQDSNTIATSQQQVSNKSATSQQPSIIEQRKNVTKEQGNKEKKTSNEVKENLTFPFTSEKFMETWNALVKTEKWRKKTTHALQLSLNKLAAYDEDFAILLMNDSIENNWQGLVYDNTAEKYDKWKAARQVTTKPEAKKSRPLYTFSSGGFDF